MSDYDPFTPEQKAELQRLGQNPVLNAVFDFMQKQTFQAFCTLDNLDTVKLQSLHSRYNAIEDIRATLKAYAGDRSG